MNPIFFEDQYDFREWLAENHDKVTEIIVGFYKVGSGKPSMTWSESVDQALCFGWIDGVTRRIDTDSYSVRFTPRRATSIWSDVNIKKIEVLTKRGLMHAAGIAAFEKRTEKKSRVYAYESEPVRLSPEFEGMFKAKKCAWEFFTTQAPSYQRTMTHWIMRAKQETTRLSRLEKTIAASADGNRVS